MADFCKQCSKELFDSDENDLSGQITEEDVENDMCVLGICEGCSGGQFDHTGECLGPCDKGHGFGFYKEDKHATG